MLDYAIVAGASVLANPQMRQRLENALVFSNFTPATTFGQPMISKMRLWFHSSRIDVRGLTSGRAASGSISLPANLFWIASRTRLAANARLLVIEIGPGRGALTEPLLERAERVIAIEVDAFLVHYLRQKFQEPIAPGRLEIDRRRCAEGRFRGGGGAR